MIAPDREQETRREGNQLIEVRGLASGYGGIQVLWGVDMNIGAGESVALIGANGAGKTTLLRALSGQIKASEGSVRFDGHDVTTMPPHERVKLGMVMVPEGRQLFAGMTVTENLLMGAYVRDDKTVDEDLERVRELFPILRERSSQLAGNMSGGEQQMCAIGRALMAKPRLLMIDELSLGLAPVIVDRLIEAIDQIHETGVTLLIVEQDVVNATTMAGRGYVMESGRVILEGESQMLLEDKRVQDAFMGI
jgi:branched-chain amino acid transport system ATP-binding protein